MIYIVNCTGDARQILHTAFLAYSEECTELDTHDLLFLQEDGQVKIFSNGKELVFTADDYVYIKSSHHDIEGTCLLANILSQKGVAFTDPVNMQCSQITDKAFQSILLPTKGIPFPRSLVGKKEAFLEQKNSELIAEYFGKEFVLKSSGSKGEGVVLVDLEKETALAEQIESVTTDENKDKFLTIQQKLEKRCDYRILVVDGVVIGRLKKCSEGFRTHFVHGGHQEEFTKDDDVRALDDLAIRAVHSVGYTVGGVDIASQDSDLYTFEVNKNPGIHGLENVVERDFVKNLIPK